MSSEREMREASGRNGQGPTGAIRLCLPATSANLGSGFDAAAVAFDFFLKIEAQAAQEFSISATGQDVEQCGRLENNLILETYKGLLAANGRPVLPLALRLVNDIPLGMGCGSSAAARLAAIQLAVHFGRLDWDARRVLEEANALEGHPDNVAACWLGGFVCAVCEGRQVHVARVDPPEAWRVILALPAEPLATSKARAVLPASYARRDVVANLQSASVLGLAFAQARGDLLRMAMKDRIHQPYRASFCPLLPLLLPLAGRDGILGVALSGAGPAVLLVVDSETNLKPACSAIEDAIAKAPTDRISVALNICRFSPQGAQQRMDLSFGQ